MKRAVVTGTAAKSEAARHTAHDWITAHDLRSIFDMAMAIDRMPAFSIANRGQKPRSGKERLFCIFELDSKHHFFRLAGQASASTGCVLITDTPTCSTNGLSASRELIHASHARATSERMRFS
jgi:hypothetical protein